MSEKPEEEQVKQLREAMTQLERLDLLLLIDRWKLIFCSNTRTDVYCFGRNVRCAVIYYFVYDVTAKLADAICHE